MQVFTDHTGSKIKLSNLPTRVISLVPSITELLLDMGVKVVGRTKFCVHPHDSIFSDSKDWRNEKF